MKCNYCEHFFSQHVQTEIHKEVFEHIRITHPEKWRAVKFSDIWAVFQESGK